VPTAAAARAARLAFPALAEAVRDYAVFLVDPDGFITYWGDGARHVKWWTREEAVGGHLRMLYPDGGSEDGTAEGHLAEAAATGESVSEGHRVRRDGSTFWAHITLTALRDDDGELLGFAKVTRDLTARRAADAALLAAAEAERARAAAEAVSAAKSQFVATMSHEVRTPINAVLGYSDLLASEIAGPLSGEQRRYVERLRTSARHLLGLVEDVLDLSRLEADRDAPIERAAGRLGDVVEAALALVEPQARERAVELDDHVGEQAAALAYLGDEARVRQILVNLLANAVKFAQPRGDAPARVTVFGGAALAPAAGVAVEGGGPWAWVRVEDTGPGIPADQLESIFEPFVQVGRRHDRPVPGAGLGLTISRQLARRMGGEISVESRVGVGSGFVLWLPVAPVASVDAGVV
jgi:PAS domain S-box-containing protein